jgi:ABC-type phosphate/phosphonate transport system ATPase subunit
VDFARRYADRVLAFREGRLVFDGPPAALAEVELAAIFDDRSAPSAVHLPASLDELELVTP